MGLFAFFFLGEKGVFRASGSTFRGFRLNHTLRSGFQSRSVRSWLCP
ncbi:hypothetical protein LptCag_0586 [Leptospirillum ferriphilum]|uniref:Uncharacterized protein n=2 Tax=Leptospirillum TaxID=179 RepID=A0A094WBS7_9BACT|nr:MAG: Hypothetical protein CGL2_11185007 [Leptospirillum sp. Group II '5-way CG']EIJ76815.1 MAG: Hypothetical protein C75L2_00830004 [Leptospirillum sp. Group II 'C75']KGA93960.1 hypothetical protein LptCag_0586 [Leptospirillum ferriphilum]